MATPGTTLDVGAGHVYWWEVMGCDYTDNTCHNQYDNIHIAALVPSMMSIVCSSYIIISGWYYHQQLGKVLGFGASLPVFISMCDATFEIMHGSDHIHNLHKGYILEGWACVFVGSLKPFSINCQTAWSLGTAVYLLFAMIICEGKQPNLGPYNWKMHIPCWGIPFIISMVGFGIEAYGVEGPWCGVHDPWHDLWMVDFFIFLNYFMLTAIYSYIFYRSHQTLKMFTDDDNYAATVAKMKTVFWSFGLYPVAYLGQWIFYALLKSAFLPSTYEWILVVVTTANLGGVYNFCLYYRLLKNQVKRNKTRRVITKLHSPRSPGEDNSSKGSSRAAISNTIGRIVSGTDTVTDSSQPSHKVLQMTNSAQFSENQVSDVCRTHSGAVGSASPIAAGSDDDTQL